VLRLHDRTAAKKAALGRHRPLEPHGQNNLEHAHHLERTYTSNAIEGNTLTAGATILVIEHGRTIGGKPRHDHMEAFDRFEAQGACRPVGMPGNRRHRNDAAREPHGNRTQPG
jgi:Fic family protein